MANRAWFTLLVRAIGLLTIGWALPMGVHFVVEIVRTLLSGSSEGVREFGLLILYNAGTIASLAFGLYLFFGGRRLIAWCLLGLRDLCPGCGYPLEGLVGAVCPECGVALPRPVTGTTAHGEAQGRS